MSPARTPKRRRLRPAWRGMGWWKWPSLVLIGICLAFLPVYIDASGSGVFRLGWAGLGIQLSGPDLDARLGSWTATGALGDCPVRLGTIAQEAAVLARLRIAPGCARRLKGLEIAAVTREGRRIAEPVAGNPNTLSAWLTAAPDTLKTLELRARNSAGKTLTARWPAPPP